MREPAPSRRRVGPWVLPPAWLPVEFEAADINALKALQAGTATPEQQKRALDVFINKVCGTYELGWHPQDDHQASFAAGRRFAGMQTVKALKLTTIRKEQEHA